MTIEQHRVLACSRNIEIEKRRAALKPHNLDHKPRTGCYSLYVPMRLPLRVEVR